jgi:hypothetical protein
LRQPLLEGRSTGLRFGIVRSEIYEEADPPHPLGLLRSSRQRPCNRRAAKQCDELAPPHVEHGLPPAPERVAATDGSLSPAYSTFRLAHPRLLVLGAI